jgi:hypothetical protein
MPRIAAPLFNDPLALFHVSPARPARQYTQSFSGVRFHTVLRGVVANVTVVARRKPLHRERVRR